ncbi:hypothetical protein NMG60_11014480, partial [Bertholletia excelsa]
MSMKNSVSDKSSGAARVRTELVGGRRLCSSSPTTPTPHNTLFLFTIVFKFNTSNFSFALFLLSPDPKPKMKFLSSSSSSAASTATATSFDDTLYNSGGTAGCLAGILRRLLCFTTLPTHPSDQIKFAGMKSQETEKTDPASTPGIVARLMGLESMPRVDLDNTQMNLSLISRSRSMNYDSQRETEDMQGNHRRVKSSLSFREPPTFLELEDFFVLSFEKEFKAKASRHKKGSAEFRRKRTDRRRESVCEEKKKENQEPHDVVMSEKLNGRTSGRKVLQPVNKCNESLDTAGEVKQSKATNHGENLKGGKQRKVEENIPMTKNFETESSSENSSPVSVLDFCEAIIDSGAPSSEEDLRLIGSNSRRKLSAELENHQHPTPGESSNAVGDVGKRKVTDGKCRGSSTKDRRRWDSGELWGEICRLAEREMVESSWVYRELRKDKGFEGIGEE